MKRFDEIREILESQNLTLKIELLEYLSDQFDSFNKNIAHFDDIICLLLDSYFKEAIPGVKNEIIDTLSKAAVFQNIEDIDFSFLISQLDIMPVEHLSRFIDILSFTHNFTLIPIIKKYEGHLSGDVRKTVESALIELSADNQG